MKFKLGDTIIGNAHAGIRYSITSKGWKGVVIEILDMIDSIGNDVITVRSINTNDTYDVSANCFDLYEIFPEDVPYSWDFVKM